MIITIKAEGPTIDPIVHYNENVECVADIDDKLRSIYKHGSLAPEDFDKFREVFEYTESEYSRLGTYQNYPEATFEFDEEDMSLIQAGHVKAAAREIFGIISTTYRDFDVASLQKIIEKYCIAKEYPDELADGWKPNTHDVAYLYRDVIHTILKIYSITKIFE